MQWQMPVPSVTPSVDDQWPHTDHRKLPLRFSGSPCLHLKIPASPSKALA
jgi:hypothetical protein